ncbi:MAG TPA: hypothetical protein VIJ24_06640 [Verrucomicrobiae bacterium]
MLFDAAPDFFPDAPGWVPGLTATVVFMDLSSFNTGQVPSVFAQIFWPGNNWNGLPEDSAG